MKGGELHLFRGKCQRGSVPLAPTEFASQAFLVELLSARSSAVALTHMPAGETPHAHQ